MRAGLIPSRALQERKILHERAAKNEESKLQGTYQFAIYLICLTIYSICLAIYLICLAI